MLEVTQKVAGSIYMHASLHGLSKLREASFMFMQAKSLHCMSSQGLGLRKCALGRGPSLFLYILCRSFGLSLVLWVGGGVMIYFASLCYLELALMLKKSGGTFIFVKEAYSFTSSKPWMKRFGSLLGFVMMWSDVTVSQPVGAAIPLLALGKYLCQPFFMECSVMPIYAVKMFSLSALSKI
jgi:amino acid transporter